MKVISLFAGIGGLTGNNRWATLVVMPKGVYDHKHIVPKVYPDSMVSEVRDRYNRGETQCEIASAMGVTQKVIWKLMVNHKLPRRPRIKRDQRGPRNAYWRGDQVTYAAFHKRVEVARGRPMSCEQCGTNCPSRRYDWANLTGRYNDVADYQRMCRQCHRAYDRHRRNGGV